MITFRRILPLIGNGILILLNLNSCSSSTTPPVLPPEIAQPANVRLADIANNADASDFEVTFALSSTRDIDELRLLVVKASMVNNIGLPEALAYDASSYSVVDLDDRRVRLLSSQTDVDGDPITEGEDYSALILAIPTETSIDAKLSIASGIKGLQQVSAVRNLTEFLNEGSGGMDADAQGNIYMGDFGANLNGGGGEVIKITPEGVSSIFATGLNGASGNDFDDLGNLFQSSITGGFISKIDPQGNVSTFVNSGISGPVGVAVLDDGSAYVANCGNHTISKVDAEGNVSLFSDSPLLSTCPNGLDLDEDGNVYTALFGNGNIIKITPSGEASIFATIPGGNNGHLLIRGQTMYVVARGAHQLFTVEMSTGQVQLFAGTGNRGNENGSLSEATFSFPNDLAFSPDGSKIYINDVDPDAGASSNISPVIIRVIELVE